MKAIVRLLPRVLRQVIERRRIDRELADEMQGHLDEKIDSLVEGGLSRGDATSAARRAFGNVTLTAERAHDVWGWPALDACWVDLRYGWRQLRRYPAFTLIAIVSSALGIGASTAVFSVLYAVLINPYPYHDPDRLVHLHVFDRGAFLFDLPLSTEQFDSFRTSPVLDAAMAMDVESMAATDEDLPSPISAGYLSSNAFDVLGVPPLLGRIFTPTDAEPHDVVLSYGYWRSHYAGRTNVIGQTLSLDYQRYTVVGVMPRRFAWWDCSVYLPLQPSADPDRLATVFARLKPGVTDDVAEPAMQSLVGHLASTRPGRFPSGFQVRLVHMTAIARGQLSGTLAVVAAAVALLLLIGCANVSILLLARGAARSQEIAVRVALGASRGRILRQLLTESILISAIAGAIGVLLADRAVDLISILLPAGTFPSEAVISLGPPVLLFSASVAIATGALFGLWPALRFSHPEFGALVRGWGRVTSVHRATRSQPAHHLLIAGQIALTLVLLAGAGATSRLFLSLLRGRLDYDPQNLISVRIDLRDRTYEDWQERVSYYDRIREAVARRPDVAAVALSLTELPPASMIRSSPVDMPGRPLTEGTSVLLSEVSADYFFTLRSPIVEGRPWTEAETRRAAHVAVVNAAMASRYWPATTPIGQWIRLPSLKAATAWTLDAPGNDGRVQIVGVVADTPNAGLTEPVSPAVYIPYSLVIGDSFHVIARLSPQPPAGSSMTTPSTLGRAIAGEVQAIDPDQPVEPARTAMSLLEDQGWARERLIASLFGAFALLALLLSATGLYSVVSYVVSQRRTEFGIRMALGATPGSIIWLVLKSALRPTLSGLTIGLGLCMIFNALLIRLTQATVRDPHVMTPIVALVIGMAIVAALVPACRAASAEPMSILRD